MEIILLKNYEGLGEAGDVVSVKPGFARNKLIPEGVALRASKRNMAIAHEKKKNENTREEEHQERQTELQKAVTVFDPATTKRKPEQFGRPRPLGRPHARGLINN